ncbi:MAG TPA: hypothetical protein PKM51_01270 [Chitinophagales bacterium]|nr:hypothetical protein [Chitinophagales bacterium]HNM31351.1 hypothetical protein [Chitinophagales bacterium]
MKYIYIIIIFITACQTATVQDHTSTGKEYFDLKGLVQQDIDTNTQRQYSELKSIRIDGKQETKQLDTVDWNKELKTIFESDINKPNWEGKYQVQTTPDKKEYLYTTQSPKLPIRSMKVQYASASDAVVLVEIEKKIGSFLFSNQQFIQYIPHQSFKITAKQSAVFMQDFNSEIDVKFLPHK